MDRGEVSDRKEMRRVPTAGAESQHEETAGHASAPASPLFGKARDSLKNHETEVIKSWLKQVIDTLGMSSLLAFPTQELTSGFPGLIQSIADAIEQPETISSRLPEITQLSSKLATLRKEDPSIDQLMDDYSLLKRLMFDAASADLRRSDTAVLNLCQNLDDGFSHVLKEGLKAYIEEHSSQLQHLADTDALTGLYNVRYFRRQLHRNLELYKRYRIPFSLMMLDLDGLKELNDVRGHHSGDLALKHLAAILATEKRETDVAVRYGGDEFFVVLPGTTAIDGERLAYRVVRDVRRLNIQSGGREITGVSVGVVSCPANGTDVGTLRAKADRALYLAKAIGGASVACYQEFRES
ncbi:MAG: GGDEF domain-containing protein [Thermoleophilia bacterium]